MVNSKFHLVELSNGRFSLELGGMSTDEFRNIVLKEFGGNVHLPPIIVSEITINGQDFTVAREFNEMYVVSRTTEGDEILREIFRSLE